MTNERTINEALNFILETENITTKEDLDKWCGHLKREKLYKYIKQLAPNHWDRLKEPKAYVRGYYEHKLIGYKVFSPKSKKEKYEKEEKSEKENAEKKEPFTCTSPAGCIACSIYKLGKMPLEEAHIMMYEIKKNSKTNESN
jgi:hypothetical protein